MKKARIFACFCLLFRFSPLLPPIHNVVESAGPGKGGKLRRRASFKGFFYTFCCENSVFLSDLSTFFVENFVPAFQTVML